MKISRRAGFSLIEALVVLAIGGMALAVIFSIGLKAGDTGFALGRRAMSAADSDIAVSDIRSLIRSFDLRPGSFYLTGVDAPLTGTSDRLEGPATLQQATSCAPQGWSGKLALILETTEKGQSLVCYANGKATPLMQWTKGEKLSFSYSRDAQEWANSYQSETEARLNLDYTPEETVWIRLSATPGVNIVERSNSGQPNIWLRPDVL